MALGTQAFVLIFLFAVGAIGGSFFNVCISRLPENMSIVRPGSHCPKCKKPIAWHDNIPVLSYVFLLGRCRHCGGDISARYPLVELLSAVLFAVLGRTLLTRGESAGAVAVYLAFTGALIVLSFIDLDHQILPDQITIPGMILAVIASAIFPALQDFPGGGRYGISVLSNVRLNAVANSLMGMAVGAGMIYLMGGIGKLVFRKEAMGFGDVKLMGMIGGLLGVWFIIVIFFIGPIYGSVIGIARWLSKGEHHVPYGPFLSMAAITMMLWGPQITEWLYGRFYPVMHYLAFGA